MAGSVTALDQTFTRVKRHWKRKGASATIFSIVETVLQPVIRRRRRLVLDVDLDEREPSTWAASETLHIFGPENIDQLHPELKKSLQIERHQEDFDGIRQGNRLFVIAFENQCLYRSYACVVDRPGLQQSVFFGEFQHLPEIRGAEIAKSMDPKIARGIGKGLHTRVLNEQLRCLKSLGYTRAVLYIMAENFLSIRGAEASGFRLRRSLTDWIVLRSMIVQKVEERGSSRWRFFHE